jgi:hypothetical protein
MRAPASTCVGGADVRVRSQRTLGHEASHRLHFGLCFKRVRGVASHGMAWHGMAWQLYEKSGSYEHSDFDVGAELVRAIEMQANGLTPPGSAPCRSYSTRIAIRQIAAHCSAWVTH